MGTPVKLLLSSESARAYLFPQSVKIRGPIRVDPHLSPRPRYRTSCVLYNGPNPVSASRWRLTVRTTSATGESFNMSKEILSGAYFVAVVPSGAQVLPTLPLVGLSNTILFRVVLPHRDGLTLRHWTRPAHRLDLVAPAGYMLPLGDCRGFRALTSSSLPPVPLTRCSTRVDSQARSKILHQKSLKTQPIGQLQ